MKFSEIANRLTGISTPLGGVSWQSTDLEVSAARRVIGGWPGLWFDFCLYHPCRGCPILAFFARVGGRLPAP